MTDPLVEELRAVLGPDRVVTDPDVRASYERDWTGRFTAPSRFVVRPRSTDEVATTLTACARAGAAVVPQGGNTGLVGGGVPRGGEVVLSTTALDAIEAVDVETGEVVVGAGTTLEAVKRAALAHGWDVGVDLAARATATIGGMVATNAGGVHLLRHGPMAHQVVGVEGVCSTGLRVGSIPALRKDNTGYHWPGILAGSEGTLAVVTRVHLRLVPHLPERVVALLAVADVDAAVRLTGALRRQVPSLQALELMLARGIELVGAHAGLPLPFPDAYPAYVLAEAAGPAGDDGAVAGALAWRS